MRSAMQWAVCWSALACLTSCRLAQEAVGPKPKDATAELIDGQQKLLRFADEYQTSMFGAIEHLRQDERLLTPKATLQWKLALVSSTISIASSANSRAAILDMAVFVMVIRMSVEEHWQPKVFGAAGMPLLEVCRSNEADIWKLASEVLTPEQQKEFHRSVAAWHRKHPLPENPTSARAMGFASEVVGEDPEASSQSGSLLSALSLDPLSGLDPAVRELTQARLFAERALYVAQRLPMLLRFQAELLTYNAMETPEIRRLVTNSTELSSSLERVAGVAEKLPAQVAREREELLKAMEAQEKTLGPLVHDAKLTLEAGSRMSESLTLALKAFDEVTKRLMAPTPAPAAPSEPFHIQDYTQAAAQVDATARRLTELLTALDRTLGSDQVQRLSEAVDPAVRRAEAGGRKILDRAFWNGLILVGVVLVAALIYRFLSVRIKPPAASPKA